MARQSDAFTTVDTAADDTCLLAFTSGTTGVPKATMHFHRDVMAACACWPPHVLRPGRRCVHRQPAAGLHLRPGRAAAVPDGVGASTVLLEKAGPNDLLDAIPRTFGATVLFTAPTSYRAMAPRPPASRCAGHGTLRKCVSAGEALPAATRALWKEATGIELIDGIGATELLHIFISADEATPSPAPPARWCPATAPAWWTTPGSECRPAPWAGWPCKGPHRLPLPGR
jgi:2-aminobenzoate-CoA ligase